MSTEMGFSCCVCGRCRIRGTHIYALFLCADCEAGIVQVEVDHPDYDFYVRRLRVMWKMLDEAAPCWEG